MHLVCIESNSNKMVMYNFAEGYAEGFPSKLRISASIEWVCSQPIDNLAKFNRLPFNIPRLPCCNLWILIQNSMDFHLEIHNHPCKNRWILVKN